MNSVTLAAKSTLPERLTPAQVQQTLESGSDAAKLALAQRTDTPPEALYYLARHGTPAVRAAVAANVATPYKADELLLQEEAEAIRAELSRKIGRLAPGLTQSERNRVREQALTILDALAADQAPMVRAVLAEEISRSNAVPHHVVRALAEDPVLAVCGPILEYSPLLSDADLSEIIEVSRVSGAINCIARRPTVSGDLSAAVVASGSESAVAALLGNANAQIREDTLDAIIDGAPSVASWHEPLVLRANLSVRAMRRISGFVAADLVTRMINVHGLSEDLGSELLGAVRRRLNHTPIDSAEAAAAEQAARHALERGHVGDEWALQAASRGDRALVIAVLGLKARIGVSAAQKLVATRDPKSLYALAWKAGLTPRTAYDLQMSLLHLPPQQLQLLKHGISWPQSEAQMAWIIDTVDS